MSFARIERGSKLEKNAGKYVSRLKNSFRQKIPIIYAKKNFKR